MSTPITNPIIVVIEYWVVISSVAGLVLAIINAVWCLVKKQRQPYWPFVGEFLYILFLPFTLPFWLWKKFKAKKAPQD
jgi:hypothetical protein